MDIGIVTVHKSTRSAIIFAEGVHVQPGIAITGQSHQAITQQYLFIHIHWFYQSSKQMHTSLLKTMTDLSTCRPICCARKNSRSLPQRWYSRNFPWMYPLMSCIERVHIIFRLVTAFKYATKSFTLAYSSSDKLHLQ